MFKLIIDGKEVGKYARVSYAKKLAETELEIGANYAEIRRGNKLYCSRRWNSKWR